MNEIEKYKNLPEELYHLFDEMTDEAYEFFQKGEYKASFNKYEDCLNIFPNPKTDYGDYANVIEWMIQNYLQLKD